MMRAKTALASLSLLLALSLSGCGSDSALTDYTSQMNTFYDAFSSGTLALEPIRLPKLHRRSCFPVWMN